jgi:hypothetical protein
MDPTSSSRSPAEQSPSRYAVNTWPRVLDAFARRVNPLLASVKQASFGGYYWVVDQAEVATDVMSCDPGALQEIWLDLVHHASLDMSSADVVASFLGRKLHPLDAKRAARASGYSRHTSPLAFRLMKDYAGAFHSERGKCFRFVYTSDDMTGALWNAPQAIVASGWTSDGRDRWFGVDACEWHAAQLEQRPSGRRRPGAEARQGDNQQGDDQHESDDDEP